MNNITVPDTTTTDYPALPAPRASVVIPSFNCAGIVCDAVDSVLNQTMQDLEVIVVDDGSVDETARVLARYSGEPRFSYMYQENRGLPGARNTGLRASRGRYVAFVDADDALAPNAIERMAAALDESGASWCVIDLLKVHGEKREVHRSDVPAGDAFYGILTDDFIRRGMFFRREDLIAVGMYDETMANREDWDINIRMLESGRPFTYLPEPLYIYVWRQGSITTGNPAKMLHYTEILLRKHHKRLADSGDVRAARIYAKNMWHLGRQYFYVTRNFRRAVACLRESLAYDRNPARVFHPVVHHLGRMLEIK